MDKKNGSVLDVSSFLLVEGSADSETDYGAINLCFDTYIVVSDDDDAESCNRDNGDGPSSLDDHEASDFKEADEDGILLEQSWSKCKGWSGDAAVECMSTEEGEEDSTNCGVRRKDAMDQMEDRLFWENCMAAGYP